MNSEPGHTRIRVVDDRREVRQGISHSMPTRFHRTVGIPLLKLSLILTLGGLCHPPVLAQPHSATNQQVGHDFWGFKDNAPQGTAAIAQTNDGFLWLGSQTGLYRFDGTRFELFHSLFGEQLPSTNISALFAPPSGGLWIGYVFGGFSFLKDGRVRNYGLEITSSPTGTVVNFAEYSNGVLWAATTSGLWKLEHSRWQRIGPESNLPAGGIREAEFDRDGTLWTLLGNRAVSEAAKLAYLRPGSNQFQRVMTDVYGHFALDADRRVVTSAESKALLDKSSGDSAERPRAYPVCPGMNVAILDRNDSVWISPPFEPIVRRVAAPQGAADALERASRSDSETYNLDPQAFSSLVDREGNVWFGDQSGVHRFFYSPLIRQELPNATEYVSVAADDQGAVWIATVGGDNFKLFLVANDQVEPRAAPAAPGGSLGFAYRSPDKTLWLGGSNGLWRLVEGRWARLETCSTASL
jgi:ligand-binding sensor domain-containing protein